MGIEVYVPWPISTWHMIKVTRPSLPMRMNPFGAKADGRTSEDAAGTPAHASRCHPRRKPPPAATPAERNWRRERWSMFCLPAWRSSISEPPA
jgi:hypothetical protein